MGNPIFCTAQTKNNQVFIISDFINLNKKIKYKPYTTPNINEILFKLDGGEYDTSLGLNME